MENPEVKDSSQSVSVAVNIRPLVTSELLLGCTDCISVVNGEPQVQLGSHSFTFDYVFGNRGSPSTQIFDKCVASIVDSLFHGYNGTVLAYGQTGSGKTYTMGTNYNGEDHSAGIIPKVMQTIFSKIEAKKSNTEFLIRVSFIEIFKEEVFDLLDPSTHTLARGDGASLAKPAGPARAPIQIRETTSGGITLAGVSEAEVRTKEEMASYLLRGSAARATGSTNMNSQSSRSHAIFTISMEQKRTSSCTAGIVQDDDILCAKLHLVDLAGSERAKRTGADGTRFQEGIHINKGLLALGNVISALGDEKRRKEGGHVPYRVSKLTRLLQDSLGGNCKTVMIACVSPADTNAEETLNTLKYANRARNIQNKAIINRDPVAAEMQRLRSQIEQLQTQGDSGTSFEEFQMLKKRIFLLETSNSNLKREFQESQTACAQYSKRALDAQVEKDKLLMIIELARNGKPWDEIESSLDQNVDLLKNYLGKIHDLESEVLRLQNTVDSKQPKHNGVDSFELDVDEICPKSSCFMDMNEFSSNPDIKNTDIDGEAEFEAKELEYSSLQENFDRELKELDQKLEEKEAEMKRFANVDTSVKQHYEKKVQELEQEKRVLQNEIDLLKHKFSNISSNTDESAQRLKEDYLQKLNLLESQAAELKRKQDAQAQLLRQKQKSDDAAKRLQDEIRRIKSQKVQLQQKIKQESEQFRSWKVSREKEVLQLKKEGRRSQFEMHKLLALNQRQKMVLQRKSEEAAMATKRLKDLLESKKASTRISIGNGQSIQVLMQTIEHELEVVVRVHEVRSEYERQMEERARMAKEVAELKEAQNLNQRNLSYYPQTMSPGARNSRIYALENMLATSSSTLVSMASQLSEAEERERAFSSKGRWNQIRSLPEAKSILNHLFDLASSSRCLSRDKEVDCKEKDCEIRDLKEKIIKLARQMEMQKLAFIRQEKLQKLATKRGSMNSDASNLNGEANEHDHRKRGARSRMIGSSTAELQDMDISDSERSDMDEDDSDWEPFKTEKQLEKKHISRTESNATTCLPLVYTDDSETEPTLDRTNSELPKDSTICCTCSKGSLCKTARCECRANKKGCHGSCNCSVNKCANRDEEKKEAHESVDEIEKDQELASQGAMLLESALKDHKTAETTTDTTNVSKRKPLTDIGNTAKRPSTTNKKWKRSSIQLIPVRPPPPTEPENAEATEKQDNSISNVQDIPSQLPRPTSHVVSNSNNPLRIRNNKQHGNIPISSNKESAPPPPKSPKNQQRSIDEKENQGL